MKHDWMRPSLPGSAIALVLASGCGERATHSERTTVRDSAGIEIVEAAGPSWESDQGWHVAPTPTLSIGKEEGDPVYLFSRIAGVQRLSDGRIAVADGGSTQIRFFDADGRHLQSVGGPGEGPGEFRFMGSIWKLGADTLAITDRPGVSYFDGEGRFVRLVRIGLAENQYRANPVGQLFSGQILTVAGSRGFGAADAGSVIRDSLRFFWYQADGTFGGPIIVMPGAERWGLEAGGVLTFPYLPFSSNPIWAVASDRFFVSPGESAELTVWRNDGTLERIVRWSRPERPVTDDLKAQLRSQLLASARDDNARRREEKFLAEVPMASHLPTFMSMLIDEEGNAWLELYRTPGEIDSSWDILAPDGVWLGTVRTPARFKPFHIGRDFILGVSRDELGVERVQSFELVKNPPAPADTN